MIGQQDFFSGIPPVARRVLLFFLFVSMLFSCGLAACAQPRALEMISLRMAGDMNRVRIIAVFNQKPDFETLVLASPPRLVITLPVMTFPAGKNLQQVSGFVNDTRYGVDGGSRSRLIFRTKVPFLVEKMTVEPLQNNIWQGVIDLVKTSEGQFRTALQPHHQVMLLKGADSQQSRQKKAFVVVVDAGHGGFDDGAIGVSGVREKDMTLAFAKVLADTLQRQAGVKVRLTREEDVFLRLNERVARARQLGADLFISVHADHIDIPSMRGATVYTLSDKASDAMAKAVADQENRADLLDGLPPDELPEVADILIDLARQETQAFSINFADLVIDTFDRKKISLIKNPHRYAGFQVLRAPDIPSVLVEMGYLSNSEDEKLIADPLWRQRMAELITEAVRGYIKTHP